MLIIREGGFGPSLARGFGGSDIRTTREGTLLACIFTQQRVVFSFADTGGGG